MIGNIGKDQVTEVGCDGQFSMIGRGFEVGVFGACHADVNAFGHRSMRVKARATAFAWGGG
jgi:hypothetical protein